MIVLESASTGHEELHHKLRRIQGETWEGCGTLPQRVPVRQLTGGVITGQRVQSLAHHTAMYRAAFSEGLRDAGKTSNVQLSEVFRESIESLRKMDEELGHLTSVPSDAVRESLSAFTEATTSVRDTSRAVHDSPAEPEWNDAKNDRRCDLIDKDIEGTILPAEKRELERLQGQMLAYRHKVAPLPLKEVQELHQQLLKKAAERDN